MELKWPLPGQLALVKKQLSWKKLVPPALETLRNGWRNRWKILITPNLYLWKLYFNYIPQWQKTRPLLYLWITFYSNLLLIDAISLCEQKVMFDFLFSFAISFQNKTTFIGKLSLNQIISGGVNNKNPTEENPPRFCSNVFQKEREEKYWKKLGTLVSLLQLFMMSNLSPLFNTLMGKMHFPQTDQQFNIYFFPLSLNLLLLLSAHL